MTWRIRGLASASIEDVAFADGRIALAADPSQGVTMRRSHASQRHRHDRGSGRLRAGPECEERYASYAHSAVFAEVRVDADFGTVRVTRLVNAVAGGRILNPKTARSQILGGVVWGIGMALHEETFMDHTLGRFMNHNFAEYHVPVNADVQGIEIIFVDEREDASIRSA